MMRDDFRDRSKLKLVAGNPTVKRKRYRRRALDEPEQVTCPTCEAELGVATSAVTEMTVAPLRTPDGRKAGGSKQFVCTYCLARGKVTPLIR